MYFSFVLGLNALTQNYKDLYTSGRLTDVTITVKNKDFRAHKSILGARSSVFAAMFEHDMLEKNSNSVCITDCDPGSFDEFLLFLYAGELEEILPSKAFSLYETANKYDVKELKEECLGVLKSKISGDTFCDSVIFATNYDETELFERATEYFIANCKTILQTVEWHSLITEYPMIVNEILLKYVNRDSVKNKK